jgi:hypothetical protein
MGGGSGRAPHPPENEQMKTVEIQVTLSHEQAWEFAQFLKRVSFSEYRNNATSDNEAYEMRDAGDQIRRALAEKGYAPR